VTTELGASFDLVFTPHGVGGDEDDRDRAAAERALALSGDALTQLANEREAEFDARFARTFPFAASAQALGAGGEPVDVLGASKAALSNLLGSMGYFYGTSRVSLPPGTKLPPKFSTVPVVKAGQPLVGLYWHEELFTAVPSRSFFPRGE